MERLLAGVDEAGRGPLAGPVVAAAVILAPDQDVSAIDDSKKLSSEERERLAADIKRAALAFSIATASVGEIDELNILQATMVAMSRAVAGLTPQPDVVQVDGNRLPSLPMPAQAIIKGDATVKAIAAASILAKVARDAMMCRLALEYPGYGFERHKGYGTRAHIEAITALGVTPAHRMSFAPVRRRAAAPS